MPSFNFEQGNHVVEPRTAATTGMQGDQNTIYEKNLQKTTDNVTRQVVTREFLKKYLSYAKSAKAPAIDGQCTDYAATLYAALRQRAAHYDQKKVSCPVTVRTLETLIRLATAHAKLRMEKSVRTDDLDIAFNLVYLSIFGTSMTDDQEASQKPASSKAKNSQAADKAPTSQASKKKVSFNKDADSDEEDEAEYKG